MNSMKLKAMPLFWAAILAGASYMLVVTNGWSGPLFTAWKGLGVGLLALWAAANAQSRDGWLIALVMALGAVGDVLLDAMGLEVGGTVFALGHMVAIWLYLRNRRVALTGSQKLLGLLTVPLAVFAAWRLPGATEGALHAALYTLFVAAMAATAWISRFPRYRTGIGAMMFLASDLFIFSRYGLLKGSLLPTLMVWPLYFGGQALIAWGVVTTLRADSRD